MLQIHPNARTTPATRAEIARSCEPSGMLARRYGVSAHYTTLSLSGGILLHAWIARGGS
jgi:hypothetical protein